MRRLALPRSAQGTTCGLVALATGLAACAPAQAPISSTQWQVTEIYSGPDRPTFLPAADQSRTYLVFGETSFTGQVGCYTISGPLSWGDSARSISISSEGTNYSDENDTGTDCLPADEDTAQRLVQVLSGREFTVKRPADNALRLEAADAERPRWETAPSVAMISGPGNSRTGDGINGEES